MMMMMTVMVAVVVMTVMTTIRMMISQTMKASNQHNGTNRFH